MRVTVYVRPKEGILDPQGEAVKRSLAELGFAVRDVRVGRLVDLDLEVATAEEAQDETARMCEQLLANPLIESFEIDVASIAPAETSS